MTGTTRACKRDDNIQCCTSEIQEYKEYIVEVLEEKKSQRKQPENKKSSKLGRKCKKNDNKPGLLNYKPGWMT
ncbi:hypothetical protein [Methanoculleus bourgensis]|uniref:hypothetical protein n=1 Tax=Methanoculleus bourgensis TaxID=83986 RepID=UPI0012F6B2B3|nr:hypothetical protein [Methanoculleus bourgensis]